MRLADGPCSGTFAVHCGDMLLAVDVGNTQTSIGVFDGDQLRCESRCSTRRDWTRDEAAVTITGLLRLHGIELSEIKHSVVACVVPPALRPLVQALRQYVGGEPVVVGPGVKTGMPIRYEPPQDVGADRIVTAVAAFRRYGEHDKRGVIVVDFGTATTFDVVSPRMEYLGGAISPGIGISADALFSRASKLPRVSVSRPEKVVGRNTVGAMQSGLFYGYVGLVEGMIRRILAEVGWQAAVVATGGFASTLAPETDAIDAADDALMLEGLRLIFDKNQATD